MADSMERLDSDPDYQQDSYEHYDDGPDSYPQVYDSDYAPEQEDGYDNNYDSDQEQEEQITREQRMREAGWPLDNRDEMLRVIRREGRNPFPDTSDQHDCANGFLWDAMMGGDDLMYSPFYDAAEQHDLELLLEMAAKPGSAWVKKFLFCRNAEFNVPVQGRDDIASIAPAFFVRSIVSLEGLEVMLLYGYELKQADIEFICLLAAENPDEFLPMFKFSLVHARRLVGAGRRLGRIDADDSNASGADLIINLDGALGTAIGGTNGHGNLKPTSLDLARFLLRAGANPNGNCFGEDWDRTPALYRAIRNQDEEMALLLLQYGADPNAAAAISFESNTLPPGIYPIPEAAAENGMSEILMDPTASTATANLNGLLQEIRDEITKPLKVKVTGILVVSFMRATGCTPPVDAVSVVASFCTWSVCPL